PDHTAQPSLSAQMEGWTTYQTSFFSFAHPVGWKIEASEKGDYVALYPSDPATLGGDKIEIALMGYEIAEGQDLQQWHEMYYRAAHGGSPLQLEILSHRKMAEENEAGVRQRLHVAMVGEPGAAQVVLLVHGRLVFSIGAYTHEPAMTAMLTKIADSLRFAPDAPRTLEALDATDQPHPSLESVLAKVRCERIGYEQGEKGPTEIDDHIEAEGGCDGD
ncbi:MAG: hypothetical protein NZ553_15085, partial [Caldilinea sp.]|nr:hypothetical protein [Caldilinea sp.]MDW8441797.1 hypothetical protein [Caldilineaceae bacterium]